MIDKLVQEMRADPSCHIVGCGAIATHRAELVIYARVERLHAPAVGAIGVQVCAEHATEENARFLLSDDAKRKTEKGFRQIGRALPDWSRSFVRWVVLE